MSGNPIFQSLKKSWTFGDTVIRLIFIHIGIFVFLNLLLLIDRLGGYKLHIEKLVEYLLLPSAVLTAMMRFWTFITYMFCHIDPMHIFFNMLGLYVFGRIIRDYIGDAKVLPLYIYGGLGGAIFFLAFISLFDSTAGALIGASAGIMAIVAAAATLVPDNTLYLLFFGQVRLVWVALLYFVLDMVALRMGGNEGGHLAHIGGAITGYFYIKALQSGRDYASYFYKVYDFFANIFVRRTPEMKSFRNSTQQTTTKTNPSFSVEKQAKLDAILEKINKSGYESLNKEEKQFLFLISKEQ